MFETVVEHNNLNAKEYKSLCGQLDQDVISKRNVSLISLHVFLDYIDSPRAEWH